MSNKARLQTTPVMVSNSDSNNASTLSDSSATEDSLVPKGGSESHDTSLSHQASSETLIEGERQHVSDSNPGGTAINDDIAVAKEEVDILSVSEVIQIYVKSCSRVTWHLS